MCSASTAATTSCRRAVIRSGRGTRAARALVEMGPRWRSRDVRIAEVTDDTKPQLLKRYLDRWYWEVKGHVGGLTPQSTDDEMRSAAPSIPVFELLR